MEPKKRLPDYVYLSPEAAQRQAERTRQGLYNLLSDELEWKDRQRHLELHGYLMRPRYMENWKPSWEGTNIAPDFCEDSITSSRPQIMDARNLKDNTLVAIKSVPTGGQELAIARFFTSLKNRDKNHCVTLIEVLTDPVEPENSLMIMPFLRPYNNPEMSTVGDVIDFVRQTLEGLAFMHSHRVAHRDIAPPNVMMDGTPLYPHGHHPVQLSDTPDVLYKATHYTRSERPVRYFFIDFGLSMRFPENASTMVLGDVGRDAEVPELSLIKPYDAFKADIYALGNFYYKEFESRYNSLEFLRPIIDSMKQHQPNLRLPPSELLILYEQTLNTFNKNAARWRLALKSEAPYERLLNDTVAVAWNGINNLKNYVN